MHTPLFLENSAGKGLVVFVHGFMGSPRQFDYLAESVHRQGYSAASLLLPGHGAAARDFASGTMELWQSHVNAEVGGLARDHGNIWLVGHSMGGLLSINAAVTHSEHVRGLFLIACPFKLTTFSANVVQARAKQIFHRKTHPMKAAYLGALSVKQSPSLLWRIVRPALELKKLILAAQDNLSDIRVPVTAVYSRADEIVCMGSLDILKSGLDNTELQQIILSDSLHAYYPERERALIESALLTQIAT